MTTRWTTAGEVSPDNVLVQFSGEGLAVLDADNRYLSMNPAGCAILGCDESEILGQRSIFVAKVARPSGNHSHGGSMWIGTSEVEFEMRQLKSAGQSTGWALRFRLADPTVRNRRKLAAFTRAASAVACETRLDIVLDQLAAEVRETVGMATCAVILVDEITGALNHVGKAGLPDDYAYRLETCRQLGAPLVTMTAINERRVVVALKWREQMLADPRFAPIQSILRTVDWDTYVVVPLISRDKVIGALGGYIDRDPGRDDIRFIAAMGDQAAVAVTNARMFARLEIQAAREERRKLARDMHDSVTQALFSLSLRTKALELGVDSVDKLELVEQLKQLHELVCGAQAEMRALIMHRRPAPLGEEGLIPSIRKHLAAIASREAIDLSVESDDEFYEFGEALDEDLFMVVSEAIHNVVKHAHATSAIVQITRQLDKSAVRLSVIDNGIGITESKSDHQSFGLVSMNDRVKAHGGYLSVHSRPVGHPHHGTTVCATVPYSPPASHVIATEPRSQGSYG